MKITASDSGYAGTVTPNGDGPARITSIEMDGAKMLVHAMTERGNVALEMVFTGDEFVGTYDGAPGQGAFNGRKLRR